MILRVSANHESFKTIHFTPGLNIVLADRSPAAGVRDSRNGLGKTTLLEIVHFCLGSRVTRGTGLRRPALAGWEFTLDLRLGQIDLSVRRAVDEPSYVMVDGPASLLSGEGQTVTRDVFRLRIGVWTRILGALMYGLPAPAPDYSPSFRALISYVAREGEEAYLSPFDHHRHQKVWERQVYNAYLLRLGWQDASEWQRLRDRGKGLEQLQEVAKSPIMNQMFGSQGELEARRVRLEEESAAEADRLRTFRVHPEYRAIEAQADDLTSEIHDLANGNVLDRRRLTNYRRAMEREEAPDGLQVEQVYRDAGLDFSDMVKRRLQEVQAFHQAVVANRRRYLEAQVTELERALDGRDMRIQSLSDERASALGVLQSHGALDEYTALQERHSDTVRRLNEVTARIDMLNAAATEELQLKMSKAQLEERARSDFDERRAQRRAASSLFNRYSQYLYQVPGNLIIDLDANGFQFRVDIERSGSHGINNMKIFCYDMTLATLWSNEPSSPGFLIHDSTIFEGVDERQRALGLVLARDESARHGFQYICMMNTDEVPEHDLPADFDLEDYSRTRLSDATETGGLLGFRF